MTVKPCTSDYMLATVAGLGLARHWFPRIVTEAFLESTIDGEIKRSPDPVTMIDGDLTYLNNTDDYQVLFVEVLRGPRTVVAQSPTTVVIHDAWSWATGPSPTADFPSVIQDSCGGSMQIDRPSAAPADLLYGRFFADFDSCQAWVTIGELAPQESMHFRYVASVQTPGTFTAPSSDSDITPRWEAHARWTRLRAMATPRGAA